MPAVQIVVTVGLVVLLGGLAVVLAGRQLRALRLDEGSSEEERRHFRGQARRRLVSAGLLGVLALMLAGSFLIEQQAEDVSNEIKSARDRGEGDGVTEADKPFVRFYGGYWIVFLLVLLGVIALAFWDLIALRRFGRSQFARLQADRRAMIEREAARLREPRNGHSGG